MANDIIETINRQPAASLTIQSIRQIFRSGDGDAVAVQLRRDGRLLSVTMVLRKSLGSRDNAARSSSGFAAEDDGGRC